MEGDIVADVEKPPEERGNPFVRARVSDLESRVTAIEDYLEQEFSGGPNVQYPAEEPTTPAEPGTETS
jgi:hypothetical protein